MGKRAIVVVLVTLVAGLAGPGVAVGAEAGLAGWWKFEGDWLDSSGNNRTGVPSGDSHSAPGFDGQALAVDGSGDYVTITGYKGILGGNPFTIAAWVKTTATGDNTMVSWGTNSAGQRVDFRLYQGRLRVEHGNGNLQGNTNLADNQWHHVAVRCPKDAAIQAPGTLLYLDGKNDSQTTADPDKYNITATTDVTIGRRRTNNDRAFPGLIDEVRIYDRALTAAEIKALVLHPKAYSPSPADGASMWGAPCSPGSRARRPNGTTSTWARTRTSGRKTWWSRDP